MLRCQMFRQRRAFHELQHQRADAIRLFEPVNDGDVGMVEGCEDLRFTLEPREAVGIVREQLWQDLQRDVAAQFPVAGAVHLTHTAGTDRRNSFERTKRVPAMSGIVLFSLSSSSTAVKRPDYTVKTTMSSRNLDQGRCQHGRFCNRSRRRSLHPNDLRSGTILAPTWRLFQLADATMIRLNDWSASDAG